jgi:membrane protein implicated in regulation of membrane protease activity
VGKLAALIGIAGVGVWTLGIVAWISGVWVTMPPDQVKVLVLTAAALSGGALVLTAAVIGRAATRIENRRLEETRMRRELPDLPFNSPDTEGDRKTAVNDRKTTSERVK